jgi:hypothetical protein
MARYILIDNCSGFIFGDSADLDGRIFTGTPTEFAAALNTALGAPGQAYEEVDFHALASDEVGYHCYRADVDGRNAVPVAEDGRNQTAIAAVMRDCAYLCTLRVHAAYCD